MTPDRVTHHPRPETLAAFAAAALDEARAVVIATHLEACEACRLAVRDFDTLGGACLEEIEPAEMAEGALERFWAQAGEREPGPHVPPKRPAPANALSAYLPQGVDDIQWRGLAPGVSQHVLKAKGYRKGTLRLLKIAPGLRVPKHTHGDNELTLILRGAYRDEIGEFRVGDLADLDHDHTHSPVAIGDEPCICLIAASAPLSFRGVIGKAMQPLLGL